MKLFAFLPISLAVLGLVACMPSEKDECRDGERGCDGNVARVCEYFRDNSCDREGGCYHDGSRWEWQYTDCSTRGGVCAANGICGKSTRPDPRCGNATHVCDGITEIECAAGFAVGESNGHLELRVDARVMHVGETKRVRIARVSTCGAIDVTESTRIESSAPDVLAVHDDATLVARAVGTASVTTDTGVVLSTFDVVP